MRDPENKVARVSRPQSATSVTNSHTTGTPSRPPTCLESIHGSSASTGDVLSSGFVSNSEGSTSLWRIIKSQQQQLNRMQRQVDEMFELLKSQGRSPLRSIGDVSSQFSDYYSGNTEIVPVITTPAAWQPSVIPESDSECDDLVSARVRGLIRKYSSVHA